MTDLKHFGNRRRLPWRSIIIYSLIVIGFLWMSERDWEQTEENKALASIVSVQSEIINATECGPTIEMMMPIGRES